jgi:tRNA U34 5-methylaminomethyl-2-thiouridine-forming methyltransferase MnmC
MKNGLQIILTEDGSHTLFAEEPREYYHSRYGAIQESKHVFIDNGLKKLKTSNITLLEVGFGTGLNALLTYLTCKYYKQQVSYDAIELYPLNIETIRELNYPQLLKHKNRQLLTEMHQLAWDREYRISQFFSLLKIKKDFNLYQPSKQYDLVYFDAFAPDVAPDMWSRNNLNKLYNALNTEGILVTYSAKGEIRRKLEDIGFVVELLPGPPGKREMIKALKP